jgi:hypothetical protein
MEELWTRDNLDKLTNIFLDKGETSWCEICSEFNIVSATPAKGLEGAQYFGAVADHYSEVYYAWYDEQSNMVIVKNPFPVAVSLVFDCHFELPNTSFVKLDAEEARKILVLGAP